jgi:hypothetical protein
MKRGVIVSKAATGRLTVFFPHNPKHIAKVKTIPGQRWFIRNADENGRRDNILSILQILYFL